jgi:2-haloacid dehalogenase
MTDKIDRRRLLAATGGLLLLSQTARSAPQVRTKGILFDAFTIFDPRSLATHLERELPGQGAALANSWRATQFQYSWIRATARQYENFTVITEQALTFAAKSLKIDLTKEKRARLMRGYFELAMYPDVPAEVAKLRAAGIRLAFMSNMTQEMVRSNLTKAGLEGFQVFSTDGAKTFKPDARAYQLGAERFGLAREEIVFAAFGGWDAAGAKWFGYRTFWMNRFQQPREELGVVPDATGTTFADLVRFVLTPA